MSNKRLSAFLITVFLIFGAKDGFEAQAQEVLANYNASWTSVLPGNVICEPAVTSYGFCIATDARNIMGYSSTGSLLWEKKIGRIRNLSLTCLPGDFILFHDKSSNILKLYNPSGSELWSKALTFKTLNGVFAGRDGRFFLYGETNIECLGINGKTKWTLETPLQKKLPVQELPDGSIVVFLDDIEGKTKGLRISPFGEMLEDITFAGSITSTLTCSHGILLTFSDGSAGLFSLKNGLSESLWVASVKNGKPVFLTSSDRQNFVLLSCAKSEITIYKINNKDGSVISSKTIRTIDGTSLLKAELSASGILLADRENLVLLNDDIQELWSAKMPEAVKNNSISHISFLNDDYLVFLSKNWSMYAYHTIQSTKSSKNYDTVLNNIQSDYSSFVKLDLNEFKYFTQSGFYAALKNPERENLIKQGNTGIKEQELLSQNLSIARLYTLDTTSSDFGIHIENSVFNTDSAGFEAILTQLALFCTVQSQEACAGIISKSTSRAYCRAILSNLTGYDPDEKILNAIQRNILKAGNKDTAYFNAVCDAVYSICFFMGRPAYNSKGKEILKTFMGTGYPSTTRTHARNTLKKIIALEL